LQKLQIDTAFSSNVTHAINENWKVLKIFHRFFRVWLFDQIVIWRFSNTPERPFKTRRSNRTKSDYQETVHKTEAYLSGRV